MPYGCPQCARIVPLEDVDLARRRLRCESCGRVFEFERPEALWRDAPAPPPPPVDLFGIPAAIDVRQPGDGTLELRIRHWQRPRHGPEALVVFHWVAFGIGGVAWGANAGRPAVAAAVGLLTLLAIPPWRRLADAWRSRTILRWDRGTGQVRAWTERSGRIDGGVRTANLARARIEVRRGPEGPELTAVDDGDPIALTGSVPIAVADWVAATLEIVRKADLRRSDGGDAQGLAQS